MLELPYINPMQLAFLSAIFLSPVIAKMTKIEVSLDHTGGMSLILVPFALFWFLGFSYFVVAVPALAWVWMSMSWPNLELPPFRLGVWHGTGIAFTAFVGVVVAFQIIQ